MKIDCPSKNIIQKVKRTETETETETEVELNGTDMITGIPDISFPEV